MTDEMKLEEVVSYLDKEEKQAFDRLHGLAFPHAVNLASLMVLARSLAEHRRGVILDAVMVENGSMSHTDCASAMLQESDRLQALLGKRIFVNHAYDPNAPGGPVFEQLAGESTADFAARVERETGQRVEVLPSAADDAPRKK